ncbi:hypothetical protein A2U01_0077683, partial [Trifolium medium]|nr:hypothetical protein [Trifolium medium]
NNIGFGQASSTVHTGVERSSYRHRARLNVEHNSHRRRAQPNCMLV